MGTGPSSAASANNQNRVNTAAAGLYYGNGPVAMNAARAGSAAEAEQALYFGYPPTRAAPPPPQVQHTLTIRSDLNLKKDTLKLEPESPGSSIYHLGFVFDANVPCRVSIHYLSKDSIQENGRVVCDDAYSPGSDPTPVEFPAGLEQSFRSKDFPLDVSKVDPAALKDVLEDRYPLIIKLEAIGGSDMPQSQLTFALFSYNDETSSLSLVPKNIKLQKIVVDGVGYVLQEIYGIENSVAPDEDEDDLDSVRACVICITDPRDTTVLPCRHMCLCAACAERLRYQTNKTCPICRTPVQSLLQIKVAPKQRGAKDNNAAAAAAAATATTAPATPAPSSAAPATSNASSVAAAAADGVEVIQL